MSDLRALAGLAVASVLLVAGCHGSKPGSAPVVSSSTGQHPTAAHPIAARLTVPPQVWPVARGGDRPPYTEARSDPGVDDEYPGRGAAGVDALHYGLDLTWDAQRRLLSGSAAISFRATRGETSITLDFGAALRPRGVRFDGRRVPARHPGSKLVVTTGPLSADSPHTVVVRYDGRPRPTQSTSSPDLSGLGWNVQPDGTVWTVQEPFGAYTWYPVDDQPSDKAFYDITWHTKASWTGVSNGRLVGDSVHDGRRTTRWQLDSPAASYLVTAVIGPYQQYRQTGPRGLPLSYWVTRPDRPVLRVLDQTPAMLQWLEARLGRYPFDSLGDVVVPAHTAVETQTMVTVGAPVLRLPAGASDLLHEYVHSWYGDEVTPSGWDDLWLNESFAFYVQLTWEASHGVATTAEWRRMLDRDDQRLRTTYGPPGRPDPGDFAALNVYECGARMLDRLRSMLGPRLFADVLRGWPQQHRFGTVNRNEWIAFLDHRTGRDLRSFVEHWLDSRRSPGRT